MVHELVHVIYRGQADWLSVGVRPAQAGLVFKDVGTAEHYYRYVRYLRLDLPTAAAPTIDGVGVNREVGA